MGNSSRTANQWNGFSLLATPIAELRPLSVLCRTGSSAWAGGNWLPNFLTIIEYTGSTLCDLFEMPRQGLLPYVTDAQDVWDSAHLGVLHDDSGSASISAQGAGTALGTVDASLSKKSQTTKGFRATSIALRAVSSQILLQEAISFSKPKITAEEVLTRLRNGDFYVVTETLEAKSLEIADGVASSVGGNATAGYGLIGVRSVVGLGHSGTDLVPEKRTP
jgi:hypothetical protein